MKTVDANGQDIAPMTLLGTHQGVLDVGCFGASIRLDGGPRLVFANPTLVPKQLWPQRRGDSVPVTVRVYLNELEQVVYDAERTDGLGTNQQEKS